MSKFTVAIYDLDGFAPYGVWIYTRPGTVNMQSSQKLNNLQFAHTSCHKLLCYTVLLYDVRNV